MTGVDVWAVLVPLLLLVRSDELVYRFICVSLSTRNSLSLYENPHL